MRYDPTQGLAESGDLALRYSYERDILGRTTIERREIWESKPARRILREQRADGGWPIAKKSVWHRADDAQYASFRRFGELVEQYRFDADHEAARRSANYFFTRQSAEGDIRGIYGAQYSPNYTAAILELLIKSGFGADERTVAGLDWLLSSRQEDGGWALPFRTQGYNLDAVDLVETIEGDRARPSSCMVTGVVLRAMALHPGFDRTAAVERAARILADGMFASDAYPDRRSPDFWTRFAFPFVYTDLLSALDTLSLLGGYMDHPNVRRAVSWLASHQDPSGHFDLHVVRGSKEAQRPWYTLVACRVLKRCFEHDEARG